MHTGGGCLFGWPEVGGWRIFEALSGPRAVPSGPELRGLKYGSGRRSERPLGRDVDHSHPFRVLDIPDQPLQGAQVTGAPLTLTVAQAVSRGPLRRGNGSSGDHGADKRAGTTVPPTNTIIGGTTQSRSVPVLL